MISVREIASKEEMLKNLGIIQEVYPDISLEQYGNMLDEMLPHNYGQIGAFIDDVCVGISGYWIYTKIWSGKCLEMDNVVVSEAHRSKGIGKMLEEYLEIKAKDNNCNMMALDAYVDNFKVHKFYVNQGYHARGYHFIKYTGKGPRR